MQQDNSKALIWCDELCDRTDGHIGVYEKYKQLTGEELRLDNVVRVEENEPDLTWVMREYIVDFCPDGNYIYKIVTL